MAEKKKPRGRKKKPEIKAIPALREEFTRRHIREPDKVTDEATGRTLLIDAVLQGDADMQAYLLQKGASPAKASLDGKTPLHYAAKTGDLGAVLRLIEAGAPVNARDKALETPLIDALHAPHADSIVSALLAASASPDIPDAQGRSAIHRAGAERVHTDILARLWRASANPELPDSQGQTPFLYACRTGTAEAASALLFERANIFAADRDGNTALHLSAMRSDQQKDSSTALNLLEQGGDILVNAVNISRQTPLHLAVRARNAALAERMVRAGASLNVRDANGVTPLQEAVTLGETEIAGLLIDAGADIEKSVSTLPLLMAAARANNAKMAAFLLDRGADPNARDAQGMTALMECAWRNDAVIATLLLEKGADASLSDNQGRGILHHAHAHMPAAMARKFIAAGAKPDAKDRDGRTPLHHAVQMYGYGVSDLVDLLLKAGADPTVADRAGTTPWDIAHMHGKSAITEMFRKELLKKGKTYKPKHPQAPPWGGPRF